MISLHFFLYWDDGYISFIELKLIERFHPTNIILQSFLFDKIL